MTLHVLGLFYHILIYFIILFCTILYCYTAKIMTTFGCEAYRHFKINYEWKRVFKISQRYDSGNKNDVKKKNIKKYLSAGYLLCMFKIEIQKIQYIFVMIFYVIDASRVHCYQMPSVAVIWSSSTANLNSIKCLMINTFCNVCSGLGFCEFLCLVFPNTLQLWPGSIQKQLTNVDERML